CLSRSPSRRALVLHSFPTRRSSDLDTDVAPLLLADLLPLTPVAQAVAGVETGGEGRARDRRACRDVGIDALPLVFLGCSCPRGGPGPPPPGTVARLPLLVVVDLVLG